MRRNRWLCFTALLLGISLIAGCAGGGEEQAGEMAEGEKKEANLVYVNWAEGVAYTNLAKVILEEEMGYDVTITAADVAPAYAAVAQGDQDAFMETWLPVLHKDYIERYKDQVVDLGHVYEGTQSGLVVPTYVEIDTISQLNEHQDKFDGKITGIDAGAGIMKTTEEEVIPAYDLELELVASSGPAMTAALQKAVNNKDWIVVTGWKPHWMFGRWDLKFLEQDEEKVWKKGNIHIMGRLNLEQDKPELAQFLKNLFFTDAQLADLMIKAKDMEDPEAAARAWKSENPDVVQSFIP
jgi:glycine betaine/proline transport system substrate-binding protein